MPERDPLVRLAARVARGDPVDWPAEERAAATETERAGIRSLRIVAALSIVSRALVSGVPDEDLKASIGRAQSLAGRAEKSDGMAAGERQAGREDLSLIHISE
ncbi:MAG: hypothetical protein QUU85_04570, partial [Candidatus Eisenbacteria bacterium]|nr:hypothetical protein [Candidatus Eisenbacteria bacterium]